jgi:hypothetical protein
MDVGAVNMLSLAKTLLGRITQRRLPDVPPDLAPLVPLTDPPELLDVAPGRTLFEADGQTFLIEYQAADGEISRRMVSVQSIGLIADSQPYLTCHCHVRNAPRHFRLDRIVRVADLNGTLHVPPGDFLAEVLGMPVEMAATAGRVSDRDHGVDRELKTRQWYSVRATIAPSAQILCALSHSDGLMSKIEIDVAIDYMKTIAPQLADGTVDPDRARLYIRSLRPTVDSLTRALEGFRTSGDTKAAVSLIYAGKRLIQADGVLEAGEVDLLNTISRELIGVSIA